MKSVFRATLAVLFFVIAGCHSDDSTTYDFKGVWLFSDLPEVCSQTLPTSLGGGTLKFETIRVRVFSSETAVDPIKTVSVPCSEGYFVVEDLNRGSYFVKVEAMAEDPVEVPPSIEESDTGDLNDDSDNFVPEIRAYYLGTSVVVVPNSYDEVIEFDMKINKGSIEVTWDFEAGSCAGDWNNVKNVNITLKGTSSLNNHDSGQLACDQKGQSYLFDKLNWDVYTITVTGFDPNNKETHIGTISKPLEIRPGTDISGTDGLVKIVRQAINSAMI